MGKGAAILGLILIIIGILPIILPMLGMGLEQYTDYFYMLNIYSLDIGGYVFSELMLILIGLGVILLIVGAVR